MIKTNGKNFIPHVLRKYDLEGLTHKSNIFHKLGKYKYPEYHIPHDFCSYVRKLDQGNQISLSNNHMNIL